MKSVLKFAFKGFGKNGLLLGVVGAIVSAIAARMAVDLYDKATGRARQPEAPPQPEPSVPLAPPAPTEIEQTPGFGA